MPDDPRIYVVTVTMIVKLLSLSSSKDFFCQQGEIQGFFMDPKFILIPGVKGLTPNGSAVLTDVELRYISLIDGSPKTDIITQGTVIYDLTEKPHIVLWPEQVEIATLQDDGTIFYRNVRSYSFNF